jgi:hypothetical protein
MQQPREGFVCFAQLEGPAADWWDAYVEAHEEPESINWQEFKNSFRSHHVPLGVMKLKKKEFERFKARLNDCERVCDSFHSVIPLRPQ